jgi:hypothetical protein
MFLMILAEKKQIVADKCDLLQEAYNSFKVKKKDTVLIGHLIWSIPS